MGLGALDWTISYERVMSQLSGKSEQAVKEHLYGELPPLWCDVYCDVTGKASEVVELVDSKFHFLFDLFRERVVAAYGESRKNPEKRDSSRMRGFLGGSIRALFKGRTDKGHFMAHAQGGGLDINLFPQRPDINRGLGGRRGYRMLEEYCAMNVGTFCFSRPIYGDESWIPMELEYGVLRHDRQFQVRRFTNAPN
jgi:hypothetical protein